MRPGGRRGNGRRQQPRVVEASSAATWQAAGQRPRRAPRFAGLLGCAALVAYAALGGKGVELEPKQGYEEDGAFVNAYRDRAGAPSSRSLIARRGRNRCWQGGYPVEQLIRQRKMQWPSVQNMKEQYFIMWARSAKVQQWCPINIVSGSEAAKNMQNMAKGNIGKVVGADKLADYQIVKSLGMNLYKNEEEVKKSAINMHPALGYAKEIQYGFKEILNNTKFNENPGKDLMKVNITVIPPEEELKNLLDDAGEVVSQASDSITKVSDNVKGFFSGLSR